MTEKDRIQGITDKIPSGIQGDALQLVNLASQAQALKVKSILERMDSINQLDPARIRNVAELLQAAKADGGCGIGCW